MGNRLIAEGFLTSKSIMSITVQILGAPGFDNILYSEVVTGDRIFRFLFDCGANCLHGLKQSTLQQIDHLLFSHFHMDHIAGFDTFFRNNYNRNGKVVNLWGPEGSRKVFYHRFQGFTWNLLKSTSRGAVVVHEAHGNVVERARLLTRDAFKKSYKLPTVEFTGKLLDTEYYEIWGHILDHGIPTLAYALKEKDSWIIDKDSMQKMALAPGRWCASLKDPAIPESEKILIGEDTHILGDLRKKLLCNKKGEKIAYATDFFLREEPSDDLLEFLANSDTLVAECSYLHEDETLARKNYHQTSSTIGELARAAGVKKLILIHISPRYGMEARRKLLFQVRKIFPETYFPRGWGH